MQSCSTFIRKGNEILPCSLFHEKKKYRKYLEIVEIFLFLEDINLLQQKKMLCVHLTFLPLPLSRVPI